MLQELRYPRRNDSGEARNSHSHTVKTRRPADWIAKFDIGVRPSSGFTLPAWLW